MGKSTVTESIENIVTDIFYVYMTVWLGFVYILKSQVFSVQTLHYHRQSRIYSRKTIHTGTKIYLIILLSVTQNHIFKEVKKPLLIQ